MAKQTIAEMRQKDVERLAQVMGDFEKAWHFFNSFYKLAGLEWRLLIMENDERYYTRNRAYIENESDRAYKWARRLDNILTPYGLRLYVSGGYISIYEIPETGTGLGRCFTYGHYYR